MTTADGKTRHFWERNLHLKTDYGEDTTSGGGIGFNRAIPCMSHHAELARFRDALGRVEFSALEARRAELAVRGKRALVPSAGTLS